MTKGNKWHVAEPDTTPRRRGVALKVSQVSALIVGKCIVGPEEMTYRGTAEGMVVPNEMVSLSPGTF